MNELNTLKTLKEIEISCCSHAPCYDEYEKNLKREAIKWIKKIESISNPSKDLIEISFSDSIGWIKHFFNLEQEIKEIQNKS